MFVRIYIAADFRYGSNATESGLSAHVRFTPGSDQLRTSWDGSFVPCTDIAHHFMAALKPFAFKRCVDPSQSLSTQGLSNRQKSTRSCISPSTVKATRGQV
jgi:hypothetical protein